MNLPVDPVQEYLALLMDLFESHRDEQKAAQMQAYMQDRFSFYGIQKPQRASLFKHFLSINGRPSPDQIDVVVKRLWCLPQREYQYSALDILYHHQHKASRTSISTYEYLIIHKSWWDTVDMVAQKLVGPHFLRYPDLRDRYIPRWKNSDNLWLNRTTLLFQNRYKSHTDFELLAGLVNHFSNSDEFYIQKAIGWALREYGKNEPDEVARLVKQQPLPPLSVREATKKLRRN